MILRSIMAGIVFAACTEVSISKTYQPEDSAFPADSMVEADDVIADTEDTEDTFTEDINGNNDTSTSLDLSQTVGYVELGLMQASCPYCFGVPQEINITAYSRFHNPTTASHTNWLPQSDGCRDYYESNVTAPNKDMGNTVNLKNNFGDNIQLSKGYDSTGVMYENGYLIESSFRRNTSHDLTVGDKNATAVVETLRGFDYVEPYTMLYVDPSYAFQAPIRKYNDNIFTWGPSGDENSFFTIHVSVYSYDGSMYYGTVICRSPDMGSMTIPGSYFAQYQTGSLASIHLMRHRILNNQYTDFGGTIEGYSWWEVIGTGYIE
jgi:hypothetical protein